jgi:hypothetical protein
MDNTMLACLLACLLLLHGHIYLAWDMGHGGIELEWLSYSKTDRKFFACIAFVLHRLGF